MLNFTAEARRGPSKTCVLRRARSRGQRESGTGAGTEGIDGGRTHQQALSVKDSDAEAVYRSLHGSARLRLRV